MAVSSASGPEATDVIPGEVVRDLVERKEREIEALLRELDQALREADEAEGFAGVAGPDERAPHGDGGEPMPDPGPPPAASRSVAARVSSSSNAGNAAVLPAPAPRGPARTTVDDRPRTTVDGRSRTPPVEPGTTVTQAAGPAGTGPGTTDSQGAAPGDTVPAVRSTGARPDSWSERFRSHLMFKAGVALTLVALILLKFG